MATRPYVQRTRADRTAKTRARILDAVHEHAQETLDLTPTLAAVASRAGVSVQTVLRHFGSREALLDAAIDAVSREVSDERAVPAGDPAKAISVLVDHYERRGDFVLRMLAGEADDPRLSRVLGPGRALHRGWVEAVFAPQLAVLSGSEREAVVDTLAVATDVYTWKLLRRDRGLSSAAAGSRILRLVDAILRSANTEAP